MKEHIKVYSHPRSGTHFLEAFIGTNFYPDDDLEIKSVTWGHWSNRKTSDKANEYGKLFGSHIFPSAIKKIDSSSIYIFRDPRAVAYSIWRTPNFLNPSLEGISFSEFLKTKLDWIGSPAFKCRKKYNIIQHWENHINGWMKLEKKFSKNILLVKYEDLVDDPIKIYQSISDKFEIRGRKNIHIIDNLTGLLPNHGKKDAWTNIYSDCDIKFTQKQIKNKSLYNLYFNE